MGEGDSEHKPVLSGVPQGSVLGPLLFLVYVNSLTAGLRTRWYAFADDFKIYTTVVSAGVVDPALQRDLNNFCSRATAWNLKLNPEKCVVIRFGSNVMNESEDGYSLMGRQLEFVTTHRDLGVVVDSKLKFHRHIGGIINKSKGLVNQLLRGTVCRKQNFMVTVFIAHIRPLMDFSARLWNVGYIGDVNRLERVQRSWVSQVEGLENMNYKDSLSLLGLHSVYGRLLRGDLIKVWQAFHPSADIGLDRLLDVQSHAATRSNGYKLAIPRCRTELRRRFWSVRCVNRWNSLPAEVVQAETVESFKRGLDRHVGDLFYSTVGE